MANVKQTRTPKIPDTFQLMDLFKLLRGTEAGAKATAWGSIGGVIGHLVSAASAKFHLTIPLQERDLLSIGFIVALAVHILLSRSHTGVRRCLGFAEIMFAERKVSAAEYRAMRGTCLKRAGLLGGKQG